MANVDLVVTDLDGTLWHTDEALHPLTTAALDELARRGIPLLVATGRRIGSTRAPLARFGLAPPAVVLNGAVALDLSTGDRFHRLVFDPVDARRALDVFTEHDLSPCVYVDHGEVEVFLGESPSTHPSHIHQLGPAAHVGDLEAVVGDLPVLAFGIIGRPEELLAPAADAISSGRLAETHLSRSLDLGGMALTVAPPGVSKWSGVLAFCALASLDPTKILAIGDGPNDVELLSHAAIAVTLEDGHASLEAIAHHKVPAARAGGWASILDLV